MKVDIMGTLWVNVICFCALIDRYELLPTPSNETSDIHNFIDDWDYRIEPHDMPLLNFSATRHSLPPSPQVHNIQVLVKKKRKPKLPKKLGDAAYSFVDCRWCDIGVTMLIDELKIGSSFEILKKKVTDMCVDFNINTKEVCEGIFDVFGPTVIAAAKMSKLNAKQACSMVLGESCKGNISNPLHQWNISFPDVPKPSVGRISPPKVGSTTFKILHLSDTHLDPDYVEGSVSNCLEPLCCRNESSEGIPEPIPAGNPFVIEALLKYGSNLDYSSETADFINIIVTWWKIVNLKTPLKGHRLRDELQMPITSKIPDDIKFTFLSDMINWLDCLKSSDFPDKLTPQTHTVLSHTPHGGGAYAKCDTPRILLENMLEHISEQHPDIDFIFWTGDLPPHDIWKQTKEYNLDIIKQTTQQMIEYFPSTPIFPAVGNHESIPPGTFAPPWVQQENSTSWLFNELSAHWKRWLPASSTTTVMRGGFYSVLLRPRLRLISINTNYCHTYNWWLLVNSTDPAKELKWLIYELQEAENKEERVLLIGHIPPGSYDCMKVWSENFNRIVARYESTISAQFYGHSHADEFEIFYDPEDLSRPTNVAYLGPSVTTFENYNPAYRIYYVDGDHPKSKGIVLDHETWTMDLEEANRVGEPTWYRLYSARKDLDIESLLPEDWNGLLKKLIDNPDAFYQFYRYYYRDSPTRPKCDNKCKLQILCDLRSGRSHVRHTLCHDLEQKFGSDK